MLVAVYRGDGDEWWWTIACGAISPLERLGPHLLPILPTVFSSDTLIIIMQKSLIHGTLACLLAFSRLRLCIFSMALISHIMVLNPFLHLPTIYADGFQGTCPVSFPLPRPCFFYLYNPFRVQPRYLSLELLGTLFDLP